MGLKEIRESYKGLYNGAEKGTMERGAYYSLYIILVRATTKKAAAVKVRSLCGVLADEQRPLCTEALEALERDNNG